MAKTNRKLSKVLKRAGFGKKGSQKGRYKTDEEYQRMRKKFIEKHNHARNQ